MGAFRFGLGQASDHGFAFGTKFVQLAGVGDRRGGPVGQRSVNLPLGFEHFIVGLRQRKMRLR